MAKPILLQWDNLDDRREVARLLAGLPPAHRYRFVAWCCTGCRVGSHRPRWVMSGRDREALQMAYRCDHADQRITNDCYGMLWGLATQYNLDLLGVVLILEQLTRGTIRIGEVERTPCTLASCSGKTGVRSSLRPESVVLSPGSGQPPSLPCTLPSNSSTNPPTS